MNVFFIILSYNSDPQVLIANLKILKEQQVIIVDNSEQDKNKVKTILSDVLLDSIQLIEPEKNIGYAKGMNVGMKTAWNNEADWCVLLNDDVVLGKQQIHEIVNAVSERPPSIIGPEGGILDKKRWTTVLLTQQEVTTSQVHIDYVSGSCFIVHKEVMDKIHGFFPPFFMYYEDVDVCIEAKRKGFAVELLQLSHFDHKQGSSIKKGSALHEYYLARNHLLFVERQAPMHIKLREMLRIPKTLYQHYLFNRAAFRGVIDFMITRFGKASIHT